MARYRRIDPYIWHDEKFTEFSDDGKLLFFHLLTSPRGNPLGCFVQGKTDMAEYLKWPMKRLALPYRELLSIGRIKYDEKTRLVLIPNYLKYNPLENENQAKTALKYLTELPYHEACFQYLKQYLEQYGKPFLKPLIDGIAYRIGYCRANTEHLALAVTVDVEKTSPADAGGVMESSLNGWGTPEALKDLYNELTPDELPAVTKMSPARTAKAKKYLAMFPERTWWIQTFEQVKASLFLRGLKPGKGHEHFKADFDWLLSKGKDGTENALKVNEGKYLGDN